MANNVQLTAEGLVKLKAELEELKGPRRLLIADAIREAKAHGDLKENAAYHEAKLNQTRLEARISELERAVQSAKIVERPADMAEGSAHLGSQITLLDLDFDDEFVVTLVGSFEADPHRDLISITSPLGIELVGKVAGDEIQVAAPQGATRYRVVAVSHG
jgi:transcription elongation factor GreA